jgi:hypothetical protein
MAGAALGAMTQGFIHFRIRFIAAPDLSCNLWSEKDDPGRASLFSLFGMVQVYLHSEQRRIRGHGVDATNRSSPRLKAYPSA